MIVEKCLGNSNKVDVYETDTDGTDHLVDCRFVVLSR